MTADERPLPRWRKRLQKEMAFRGEFADLDEAQWRDLLKRRRITSKNQDTVLALDWPHYCAQATEACGGVDGWCYTFQGNQTTKRHDRHVVMVDVLARRFPGIFAEKVSEEVKATVTSGGMKYPNLRYSGSGEVATGHIPALEGVADAGVHLWGFTRDLRIAECLRALGAAVIISCDASSSPDMVRRARAAGFSLAYSSAGVWDSPPPGTIVTFPVHKVGRVREVVDASSLCPKVVMDYLEESRPAGSCQLLCSRCHRPLTP